jgi:hypothetical protein
MHLTLSGTTILDDNDSDGFVKFEIATDGLQNVSGQVGGSPQEDFVRLKFQTDQTCIPQFLEDFKS